MSLYRIILKKSPLQGFFKFSIFVALSGGFCVAWSAETLVPASVEDIEVFDQQVKSLQVNIDKQVDDNSDSKIKVNKMNENSQINKVKLTPLRRKKNSPFSRVDLNAKTTPASDIKFPLK